MKAVAWILNLILWILLGLIVFQNYTGVQIGILNYIGNLRLLTDIYGLVVLLIDVLTYTGVMGGKKNMNLASVSGIFLVWIVINVVCKYLLKLSNTGFLYSGWDVLVYGFAAPYLAFKGRK